MTVQTLKKSKLSTIWLHRVRAILCYITCKHAAVAKREAIAQEMWSIKRSKR